MDYLLYQKFKNVDESLSDKTTKSPLNKSAREEQSLPVFGHLLNIHTFTTESLQMTVLSHI